MKGRKAPPADPKEQARLDALRMGTPEAIRAWALRFNVALLPCTDELLLVSIHEARIWEPAMLPMARAVSRRWLKKKGTVQ